MKHNLKLLPEYFIAILEGRKSFEIRKDDRGFELGDILILQEFDGTRYTGREIVATVLLKLKNEYCRDGYCTMSIVPKVYKNCKVTNYQRIRNMNVEEMHEFLIEFNTNRATRGLIMSLPETTGLSYNDGIKVWLESEVQHAEL